MLPEHCEIVNIRTWICIIPTVALWIYESQWFLWFIYSHHNIYYKYTGKKSIIFKNIKEFYHNDSSWMKCKYIKSNVRQHILNVAPASISMEILL